MKEAKRLEREKKSEELAIALQEVESAGQIIFRSANKEKEPSKALPLIMIGNTQVQIPLPVG